MAIVAVVVALVLVFAAVRFVIAIRDGHSARERPARPMAKAGNVGLGVNGPKPTPGDKAAMQRRLDAEHERLRKEAARWAAEQAAANARRTQEDMAKRSRERARAETERMTRNAIKRGRGW